MNKFLLLACLVVSCVGTVGAQRKGGAAGNGEIAFVKTEHDFGKVPERGKTVSVVFEFTNTGSHPLVITRMSTTCRCTSYDFSKKPVAPGAKGLITVSYNPRKQRGVFYKTIQVYTNCAREREMLAIRGEVIE